MSHASYTSLSSSHQDETSSEQVQQNGSHPQAPPKTRLGEDAVDPETSVALQVAEADATHGSEDAVQPVVSPEAPAREPTGIDAPTPAVPEAGVHDELLGALSLSQRVAGDNHGTITGIAYTYNTYLRGRMDSHLLPERYVQRCVKVFVAPPGMVEAKNRFREERVVVVLAEPDHGRHDIAVNLLASLVGVASLREAPRDPRDRLDVDALRVEKGTGWLLDLRDDDGVPQRDLGRVLIATREILAGRGSCMAVLVAPATWREVGAGGEDLAFHIVAPVAAAEIVQARVKAFAIDPSPYLEDPAVRARLAHVSPLEAVRWAEAVWAVDSAAVDSAIAQDGDPKKIRAHRIEQLLEAQAQWHDTLRQWHKENRDSRVRNFLLAAALMEGLPAGTIFTAAGEVAQKLGEDAPDVAGQRGAGIFELVELIGADLVDGERIEFTRHDYATAVIDYFWIDRQHLREDFLTWMCSLPSTLGGEDAERVTRRISEYVLRSAIRARSVHLLRKLAYGWASIPHLRPVLTAMLTAAALDPDVGRLVRQDLLTWAGAERQSATVALKTVVAEVSGGDFARVHPTAALFRLGRLGESEEPEIIDAVSAAVARIWEHRELRAVVIDRVSSWCTSDKAPQRRAGAATFLALTTVREPTSAPGLFTDSALDRTLLARGWQVVLEQGVRTVTEEALSAWLDSTLPSADRQRFLIESLVDAVRGGDGTGPVLLRQSTLTTLLFAWQPAKRPEEDRNSLRDQVMQTVSQSRQEYSPLDAVQTQLTESPRHV